MVNAKYDSTDGILGNHVFFVFYEFQNKLAKVHVRAKIEIRSFG